MGKGLLADPVFRQAVREVDELFARHAGFSLEAELVGGGGEDRYQHAEIAQPALFALQVGITRMLCHRGLVPAAVAGHSVGEVAAAWASGALSLPAAVEVIFHRSRLQGTTKGRGGMTAVTIGGKAARELLEELTLSSTLALAAVNSSKGVTIAGSTEDLERLESVLTERAIFFRRLDLDYPFHSPAMDAIASKLREALADLRPGDDAAPFHSTVTGGHLAGKELDVNYWWRNIRRPVLFEQTIKGLIADGINIFVEVGPHSLLRGYIGDCLGDAGASGRIIATAKRGDDSPQRIWTSACQAMIAGATVNWQRLFPWQGRHVRLPNYPWQRERCWHPVTQESLGLLYRAKVHPLLGYPLQQHELTWENELDTLSHPLLADHVVGEAAVFPGSGYSELALAAAFRWHPGEFAEIEELEIRAPLLLSKERTHKMRLAIDPQDGSFSVRTRELLSGDAWTLHAVGRILREPGQVRLHRTLGPLPTRQPDFNGHSHEALAIAAGLGYGPAFKAIEHGWVQGQSALAVFQIPEVVETELDKHHLHPALLDCAFQLIIQLLKDPATDDDGITFVPMRIGHITIHSGRSKPRFARATLRSRAPHSVVAEFAIFDEAHEPIAIVEQARFRGIRLHRGVADHLRYLEYCAVPRPLPAASGVPAGLAIDRVNAVMEEPFRRTALERTHRTYCEEIEPLLDELCSRFTAEALRVMADKDGCIADGGASVAGDAVPYFQHLLALAGEDGLVDAAGARWPLRPTGEGQATAQDIWNSLIADYPDYFAVIHAVGRVGMHLRSLLDGSLPFDRVWPNDTALATLMRQILGAGAKVRIGKALHELLASALRDLPEGKRVAVIELSEELPPFASNLCANLDFDRADYLFASTSAATMEEARRIQEQHPAILLAGIKSGDIDVEPASVAGAHFQLAIVTLNFVCLRDATRVLDYARCRLAPGGSIIVFGQHPSRWVDFVFGRDPQWWSASTQDVLLSRQRPVGFWQQQLEQLGFASIRLQEFSPNTGSGPYLLLARLAEPARLPLQAHPPKIRNWLLLADEDGHSATVAIHLADSLLGHGHRVIRARPGGAAQIAALLQDAIASLGGLDGIVHLSGLYRDNAGSATTLLDTQVDRCKTAAALAQACESTQTNTTCWLVTAGAATHLLPPRAPQAAIGQASAIADAALWGLGRTLMNEACGYAVRLVDLENVTDLGTAAVALVRELENPDEEQEIALTAAGERFATRLRFTSRPEPRGALAPRPQDSPSVRLGFALPGQLRNLRWEAHPRRSPGEGEVEIRVRATGLNFRDVMYALGLLSDEAIEGGFAGPSLGLEFSGIVLEVGPEAAGFAVGDHVVGFGPSSFGDRVVTRASALSHIPSGMSFEAAATIPSTFFTAYYALHHLARLQPGEKLLIHGAAGGVGIAAIQVAQWSGAEIYATAGSDEKRDFLRLLGIEHVFDSRTLAFADEILAVTDGRGVDVVLNSLAGEAINRNLQLLKPFGRFLELGKRDFYENTRIGLRPFRNNVSYFGIDADQLMNEQPQLTQRLFAEVMGLFGEGVLHPLPYRAFEAQDVVDAFRYMQQARQIGKIVVTYAAGVPAPATAARAEQRRLEVAPDASFLITGGLSGFGLRSAQWLVERGARHLVLISRSGPTSEEVRTAVAALERQGVSVLARACDVTDRAALGALLEEVAATLPPLRGVVHAAAVIDDSLMRNTSAEQICRVLAPKVLGALHLDELTRGMPLDFFVLYSSATTLFGNPGQGSYVAANATLEALARGRRASGLPATCVLWGAIGDVGFLARNQQIKDALQARMGGSALASAVALEVLEQMLLADRSDLGVLEFDWRALTRSLPSAPSPKFSDLAHRGEEGDGEAEAESAEDIRRLVAELSNVELATTFTEMLKQEVGEILRVAPEKIDASHSIYDMGLDSLMGVELVIALEARFGIRLPVMALSESPTIARLTERIIARLRGDEAAELAAGRPEEMRAQIQQIASQHAAEVTSEVVTRITEEMLADSPRQSQRMIR
ncbi:Polyketide synthase (fragment) [Burkholderiales bacterium]